VTLDLTRVSGAGDLGAAEFVVKFNGTVLQLDSAQVLQGGLGNASAAGEYSIAYAGINANGSGSMVLATLFLRVLASAPAGARAVLQLSTPYPPLNTSLTAYTAPLILSARYECDETRLTLAGGRAGERVRSEREQRRKSEFGCGTGVHRSGGHSSAASAGARFGGGGDGAIDACTG
jgi:hypothetical protein